MTFYYGVRGIQNRNERNNFCFYIIIQTAPHNTPQIRFKISFFLIEKYTACDLADCITPVGSITRCSFGKGPMLLPYLQCRGPHLRGQVKSSLQLLGELDMTATISAYM